MILNPKQSYQYKERLETIAGSRKNAQQNIVMSLQAPTYENKQMIGHKLNCSILEKVSGSDSVVI